MDLKPAHARQRAARRANFGGEIGKRGDVVADQRRRVRQLRAGQLHAVARVAAEADRRVLEVLERPWNSWELRFVRLVDIVLRLVSAENLTRGSHRLGAVASGGRQQRPWRGGCRLSAFSVLVHIIGSRWQIVNGLGKCSTRYRKMPDALTVPAGFPSPSTIGQPAITAVRHFANRRSDRLAGLEAEPAPHHHVANRHIHPPAAGHQLQASRSVKMPTSFPFSSTECAAGLVVFEQLEHVAHGRLRRDAHRRRRVSLFDGVALQIQVAVPSAENRFADGPPKVSGYQ